MAALPLRKQESRLWHPPLSLKSRLPRLTTGEGRPTARPLPPNGPTNRHFSGTERKIFCSLAIAWAWLRIAGSSLM